MQIEWAADPTPFPPPEYHLSSDDRDVFTTEIKREQDNTSILELVHPADVAQFVCVRSEFLVHTSGKPRAMLDYKHPNAFITTASCNYESLLDVAEPLLPDDEILSWDQKHAYLHLVIREADRKVLAFHFLAVSSFQSPCPLVLPSLPGRGRK